MHTNECLPGLLRAETATQLHSPWRLADRFSAVLAPDLLDVRCENVVPTSVTPPCDNTKKNCHKDVW